MNKMKLFKYVRNLKKNSATYLSKLYNLKKIIMGTNLSIFYWVFLF
jgi:hypothetical protein